MLKIITSVVLTLATIMSVTLYAVTVPAQSQKIEENKTAIEKNTEYIQDVEDFAYTVDGITDGLNTSLENLQDAFDVLDNNLGLPENAAQIIDNVIIDDYSRNRLENGLSIMLSQAVYISGNITCKDISSSELSTFKTIDNNSYYFLLFRLSDGTPTQNTMFMVVDRNSYNITISSGYNIL